MSTATGTPTPTPLWNPFDAGYRVDPYPTFKLLLEVQPRLQNAPGFWVVSSHSDCLMLLRDRRMINDGNRPEVQDRMTAWRRRAEGPVQARPFLFLDPPDHTRLRGLVSKAFTARVVEGMRQQIEELVDRLLDSALSKGSFDLIEDLAYPLPVRVISDLLGVPVSDHDLFRSWSGALARGLDPDELLTDEQRDQRDRALESFVAYFSDLIGRRRGHPGDDLLSALVSVEERGDVLSEEELLATCILLLVAGHETTVNLIGNGTLALLRHRGEWERLCREPQSIRSAVEELLRFDSPVQLTGRIALGDLDLEAVDGRPPVTLRRGDFVILLLAAANHDPVVFDSPDQLDIARADNHHLSFGFGTHFCLGAPLARLEAQSALGALARRAPALELAGDGQPPYRDNLVLRGLESLPVTVG